MAQDGGGGVFALRGRIWFQCRFISSTLSFYNFDATRSGAAVRSKRLLFVCSSIVCPASETDMRSVGQTLCTRVCACQCVCACVGLHIIIIIDIHTCVCLCYNKTDDTTRMFISSSAVHAPVSYYRATSGYSSDCERPWPMRAVHTSKGAALLFHESYKQIYKFGTL